MSEYDGDLYDESENDVESENGDTPDEIPKDISLSRIKFPSKEIKIADGDVRDCVFKFLKKNIKTDGNFKMNEPTVHDSNGTEVFVVECEVKKKKNRTGKVDVNYGQLSFVYWGFNEKDLVIYCFHRSAFSQAWQSLLNVRDCNFPRKFGKTFLNSSNIRSVKALFLAGSNTNQLELKYPEGEFKSSEIMDRYGIVRSFSSTVNKETSHGDELAAMLNSHRSPINVQEGQIKLPLRISGAGKEFLAESYIDLLLTIHRNTFDTTMEIVGDWRFLDYIQPIFDTAKTNKFKDALMKDMFDYLCDALTKQSSFNPNSNFNYKYQDCYESSEEVELMFKGKRIETLGKGASIVIEDVFKILRKDDRLGEPKDFKNVNLRFYDFTSRKTVSKKIIDMIHAQLSIKDGDRISPTFSHKGIWYGIDCDSYFSVLLQFVNTVKECLLLPNSNGNKMFPEILPWYVNKTKEEENPWFSIEDVYNFCKVSSENQQSDEEKEQQKLLEILTEQTQLVKDVTPPTVSEISSRNKTLVFKNNLLGNQEQLQELTQNQSHSFDLLQLNTCIMNKSSINEKFSAGKSSQKKSKAPAGESDKPKSTSKCNDEAKFDLKILTTNESFKISMNETENVKKINSYLEASKPTLTTVKDQSLFYVRTPYLTYTVWKEIEKACINICPVRLVQFLRMNFNYLSEGDYNELYHLSNCICRNSDFFYMVGDRIDSPLNHGVELFDVMAVNLKMDIAYLLHVKSKFDATAARAMCSQVAMCGSELWNSLTANSTKSMLQRFYIEATKAVKESNEMYIHKKLSKKEIAKISASEEEFLDRMISGMHYNVCAAPCVSNRSFADLLEANLDHRFSKSDFNDDSFVIRVLEKMEIIDKFRKTVTPKFFTTKDTFIANATKEYGIPKSKAGTMYDKIKGKVTGNHPEFFYANSSFVSKFELVELCKKFYSFSGCGNRIKFGILEIPPLEKSFNDSYGIQNSVYVKKELLKRSSPFPPSFQPTPKKQSSLSVKKETPNSESKWNLQLPSQQSASPKNRGTPKGKASPVPKNQPSSSAKNRGTPTRQAPLTPLTSQAIIMTSSSEALATDESKRQAACKRIFDS